MQQINEILLNGAISILVIMLGIAVKAVKDYLIKKGGEQTVTQWNRSHPRLATRAKKNWSKHELKSVQSLTNTTSV